MKLWIVIFISYILLALMCNGIGWSKGKFIYLLLTSLLLITLAALRSLSIGADTFNYYSIYTEDGLRTWSDVLNSFFMRYFGGAGNNGRDMGYVVLVRLFYEITDDFHLFTFLAQWIFYIPFCLVLYRYLDDYLQLTIAMLLYFSLFGGQYFTNCRQLYAMGFCLMAFLCFLDRKYIIGTVLMLVAHTIHLSSVLFWLAIILTLVQRLDIKYIHKITFYLIPVVLVFVNQIISLMGRFMGVERYAAYGEGESQGGAITFIALLLFSSILSYKTFKFECYDDDLKLRGLYAMAPLFTFFGPMVHSSGSMIRMGMYFYIFLPIMIPYIIDRLISENDRKTAYILCILALAFLQVVGNSTGITYYFYWEEGYM